ncbi:MAG: mandelate racemase/muconate lactonizing enzyme family protein [Betaproteobacteria bacterium]|nr:mandelate racemase/muconate lactonizing enzyme family protein [Betaproteobacteria bacterium]
MSSILDIKTDLYRIELPVTLSDSTHGDMTHFELVTARIRDASGAEGVGYTVTVGCNGHAIHATIEHDIASRLAGQNADLIEFLWRKMWWATHYGGRGGAASMAIAAIDIALWDLKARKFGVPLWTLLGGHDAKVPCYAGGIDLYFTLGQLLAQTDDNLKRGFRAIKMKVGRPSLSEDAARVKAMRSHLGADFPLMVDANMRWSPDEAIRAARAFQAHDIYWLEEPTIPDDVEGHARVVREGGVPVATGENLHTLYEFAQMIRAGAVTFPEPDVTVCGGVTGFMKIARLAEGFNLPVTSHGAHDVTVHLLAAAPNRSYLEAHGFGLDRYIAQPLKIHEGFAIAPDRPGHGIEFDWQALEACRL